MIGIFSSCINAKPVGLPTVLEHPNFEETDCKGYVIRGMRYGASIFGPAMVGGAIAGVLFTVGTCGVGGIALAAVGGAVAVAGIGLGLGAAGGAVHGAIAGKC